MEKKVYHLDDLIGGSDTSDNTTESKKPSQPTVEKIIPTEAPKEEQKESTIVTPKTSSLNTASGKINPANISDLKPMKKKISPDKRFEAEEMQLIDSGIERVKKEQMLPLINDFKEKCAEVRLEKEMNGEIPPKAVEDIVAGEDSEEEKPAVKDDEQMDLQVRDHTEFKVNDMSNFEESIKNAPSVELDENDFKDDDLDNNETDESLDKKAEGEEDPEQLKKERAEYNAASEKIAEILRPNVIDFSKFTLSRNPISITKAVSYTEEHSKNASMSQSVPLINTGKMISFTPLSGSEIVSMSPERYDSTLEVLRKQFNIMYEHDVSQSSKPKFSQWLRSIDAGDLNQLFFGLYKATFADANYVSYQCPKCNSFFMTKCSMDDMIVLNKDIDPKQKERLDNIIEHGHVEDNFEARTELYQVSSTYAVVLKPKSLYNVLEPYYLDEKFRNDYSSIINLMAYIGNIYYIDQEKMELKPIDTKTDNGSIAKTFRNKCVVVYKMINSISADDYGRLNGKIINLGLKENEASNIYSYQIPEQKCQGEFTEGESEGQKCTNVIKAEETAPLNLLFTRHQLATRSTLRVD